MSMNRGALLALFVLIPALAVSASIKDSSFNVVNLYYTGSSSSDSGQYYLDGVPTKGNPNVGIEICDEGSVYVGAAYAINVQGTWKYALVTYKDSSNALAQASSSGSASGCYFTPVDFLTFSPYSYTSPDPDVYIAAFPGKMYVAYESTSNPGTLSHFVYVGNNGYLRGSYSASRSFDESTCTVSVQEPTITFNYYGGSFSASASNSVVGLSSDRRMVLGICSDDSGSSCYSGDVYSSASVFPLSLSTGLTGSPCVTDQMTPITRYLVINGMGSQFCIGPNLKVSISSLSPNPVYYNMTLTVNYVISNPRDTPYETNGGNVGVTTDFDVHIQIYNASNPSDVVEDVTVPITDDISPGDSVTKTFTWRAAVHSGNYVIKFDVDSGGVIGECNEGDNSAQQTFEVKPVVLPQVYINGNRTDHFEYAGRPYNVSIYFKNSDNETLRNAQVYITEYNGLNVFAPTQFWNATFNSTGGRELRTLNVSSRMETQADYDGWLNITLIPTGNKYEDPSYSYLNVQSALGDYEIQLSGKYLKGSTWDDFKFVRNDQLYSYYPLQVDHPYTYESYSSRQSFLNQPYVSLTIDFIYSAFAGFWHAVMGW